jgi:hypothetical protein
MRGAAAPRHVERLKLPKVARSIGRPRNEPKCKMIGIWKQLTAPGFLRAGLVVLLLGGAYFASLPWTSCAFAMGPRWEPNLVRVCSFGMGDPAFDRTGPGPLWPYPLFAAIYLFAALAVAFTRRIGFGAATRT